MSKIVDSIVQASIDSKNYTGVVLARLEFKGSGGFHRFANTYQTIYWDEGAGEVPYYGLGNLASISTLTESNELGATTIQLTLSGIPNELIADGFGDEYRNQPVYVWYGTLDKDTYAVEGGASGPVLIFAGLMDFANIVFGKTATVSITATSRLADWERAKGGSFNHSYQQTYVDPTDQGFRWVVALQNKEISWGSYSIEDNNGGPNIGGGACFDFGTKFIMQDGSLKDIQGIRVGDVMLEGGKVLQIMQGYGLNQDWYLYNNEVVVTGEHLVKEEKGWIMVKDSSLSVSTYPREYTYCLDNENMLMISENNIVFSDYRTFPDQIWEDLRNELSIGFQNSRG